MNNIKNTEKTGYGNNEQLPLVTVITPAYNRESLLEETISSVLSQDYPNLEFIVLDDGSTDNTLQVIKKYHDKIRWETHENMGETNTVNKGFSMANGEIIGIVNSDDPLLPGAIRKMVELIISKPELAVVYPDWNMIDCKGKVIQNIKTYEYSSSSDMIRRHYCLPGPGAFFRREVIEKLKGRDPQFRYVADLDFWFRACLLGPFERVPETLATFRVHPDSATLSHQGIVMAEEHIRLIEKVYSLHGLPDEVVKVKKEAYSSAYYIAGCTCGKGALFARIKYFFQSFYYAPFKYLGEYKVRLLMMVLVLLGFSYIRVYTFFMRLRGRVVHKNKDNKQ
jgi:glycosyltransferase involved in cell wall biosynthesis